MAAVNVTSAPAPASIGPEPDGPIVGAICPHDDFVYAGRVYRRALERIIAKTVVVVGTHHGYRKFRHTKAVVDSHDAWWTPDGPARCSTLREALVAQGVALVDDEAHDLEHSIEPIVSWLRDRDPDVEILPILPPGGAFEAVAGAAEACAGALFDAMELRGLELGRDVQVVISADAIHYGADFEMTRYGIGRAAHTQAVAEDHRILRTYLSGEMTNQCQVDLLGTLVEAEDPDRYRWPWCGRFAIPFGVALLRALAIVDHRRVLAWPLAYETSMSTPRLPVDLPPLGVTAPASFEHFVGYPAVWFTLAPLATGASS
jgi:AmmeMemoRadiSam system protein B